MARLVAGDVPKCSLEETRDVQAPPSHSARLAQRAAVVAELLEHDPDGEWDSEELDEIEAAMSAGAAPAAHGATAPPHAPRSA